MGSQGGVTGRGGLPVPESRGIKLQAITSYKHPIASTEVGSADGAMVTQRATPMKGRLADRQGTVANG